MPENNENKKKELVVTLGDIPTPIPMYNMFLIRGTSDFMEIQLATRSETDTETKVHVESIFRIDKEYVPMFARQFADYLQGLSTQETKE